MVANSNVLIKDLELGIKKVIINDPKTYNSLSLVTLNLLLNLILMQLFLLISKLHYLILLLENDY